MYCQCFLFHKGYLKAKGTHIHTPASLAISLPPLILFFFPSLSHRYPPKHMSFYLSSKGVFRFIVPYLTVLRCSSFCLRTSFRMACLLMDILRGPPMALPLFPEAELLLRGGPACDRAGGRVFRSAPS